tara:strand:- start:1577 stop:1708 length:132 start_codon:yes stop_codon:yes gene_type:complete
VIALVVHILGQTDFAAIAEIVVIIIKDPENKWENAQVWSIWIS